MDDLTRRAIAAYFRTAQEDGAMADQPNASMSGTVTHDGKTYVVLEGGRGHGPLAVYRVRTSGQLKRLRRWPAEVAER